MSRDKYNNIKKYAAFIFMVFTVLSGSSDGIDSDNFVKIGKRAFIDILATNKLFIQDVKVSVSESRIKKSEKDHEGFRGLLAINVTDSAPKHVEFYILPLMVLTYYLNNLILKNSIWKSALF
ncbi:MAG TPA: hypothetical protein VEF53_13555 [Patescibacteria group bacterium]|nr:hypothetical protein [Patescibacteria group bacterium]